MDTSATDFVCAGGFEELKAKGRLVVHGPHRPILVVHDKDRVFALDNRCPHMGFPLDRGSVEDGTLTTSASALAGSIALRASGRLWITVQTEPDFSTRTAMTSSLRIVGLHGLEWVN